MLDPRAERHEGGADAVAEVGARPHESADTPFEGGALEAVSRADAGFEVHVQGVHGGSFRDDEGIVRAYDRVIN